MNKVTKIHPSPASPPGHLSGETLQWFDGVLRDYCLEPHHVRLLTLAAEAYDRTRQARDAIARDGITVPTATGLKAHPCVAIERDARTAFARLLRELDLDCGPLRETPRPPAIPSNRG